MFYIGSSVIDGTITYNDHKNIDIYRTIQGESPLVVGFDSEKKFEPTLETRTRASEIGIACIADRVYSAPTSREISKQLEEKVINQSNILNAKVKKSDSSKQSKILDALNTLEIFALFCIHHNATSTHKKDIFIESKEIIRHGPRAYERKLGTFIDYDKTGSKLVKEIEEINQLLKYPATSSFVKKTYVKRIKHHVDKLFVDNLDFSHQNTFGPVVEKAKEIIKKIG